MRWLLLVAMVASGSARAQALEQELANWSLLTVWGREGKARWFAEAQSRVSLTTGRFDRLLLRAAVGFQLTPEVSLWAGYGWTPSFTPAYRDEQRPWQQLLVEQKFGVVSLVNRFRTEERFIADTGGPSYRLRHMVRAVIRFGHDSPWGLAVFDEFFVTLNSVERGPLAGFDQNRAFAGVNVKVAEWQFELGYMNNVVNRPAPQADRLSHNITAMIVLVVP